MEGERQLSSRTNCDSFAKILPAISNFSQFLRISIALMPVSYTINKANHHPMLSIKAISLQEGFLLSPILIK